MSPYPLYRITLRDYVWHVTRPKATIDHAFDTIEGAMMFVRNDSGDSAELVEIVADNVYMVKRLSRAS